MVRFLKSTISLLAAIVFLSGCYPEKETIVPTSDLRVVDGDTVEWGSERIRLMGYDTPEKYWPQCSEEYDRAVIASKRLTQLISEYSEVSLFIQSERDRYDRLLATMHFDGLNIADIMVSEGLARRYQGGQRQSWCE